MKTKATEEKPLLRRQFASDNYAGICPAAWATMEAANRGHARAYGDDEWTRLACDEFRAFFECNCEVFFVFNGTAANSLALAALCQSYHSVICAETSHVETDECGAPEFFSNGTKILLVSAQDGKIEPERIARVVQRRTDIHYPKPRVVSVTQATELGTVYTPEELRSVSGTCRDLGLRLHMDGARFANALASLGVAPKAISWEAGVDVLCFGGTKQGMGVGEAVIFFNRELASEFDYRCKQAGQLASKMRFLSAPWLGMLREGFLLRYATHANHCAKVLEQGLREAGLRMLFPCEANAVFVEMPPALKEGLRARGWIFYDFIGSGGVRLMCSWDTAEEDIEAFTKDVRELIG